MAQNITVVIIDSDIDSINSMTNYIKKLDSKVVLEGTATTFERGYELIHKRRPMVVIIEVEKDVDASIEKITQILNRFPQISVFI